MMSSQEYYEYLQQWWFEIEYYTSLYLPSSFSFFERLVIIGLFFGIFVWIFRKLKGV